MWGTLVAMHYRLMQIVGSACTYFVADRALISCTWLLDGVLCMQVQVLIEPTHVKPG